MDKAEENIRVKPSGWYYADLAVAIVTVLGLGFTGLSIIYHAIFYVPVIAFFAIIIVGLSKKRYTHKLSKPCRIAAGVIRGTLYVIVLSAFAVPTIMNTSEPALYPLQNAVYRCNFAERGKNTLYFLPDKIPRNSRGYNIEMFPGLLQGAAFVQIDFFTDSEWLAVYRNYAESCGAVKSTEKRVNKKTGNEESLELWKFHIHDDKYAYYCIWSESGYFMIYFLY